MTLKSRFFWYLESGRRVRAERLRPPPFPCRRRPLRRAVPVPWQEDTLAFAPLSSPSVPECSTGYAVIRGRLHRGHFCFLRAVVQRLAPLHLAGKMMTIEVRSRPRYKAADLMAEMPEGLPHAEGWDEMHSSAPGTMSMRKLFQFAESQKNIDRLAIRLGVCIAVLGTLLAIATIVAMIAKGTR